MNCAEFQKILPEYMESGGSAQGKAHLTSCTLCSDLVQDLQYIAEAAQLLVPMEDPSPRVWHGIQHSLEKEGIVRPARGPVRIEPFLVPSRSNWQWRGIAILGLALLALVALMRYTALKRSPEVSSVQSIAATVAMDNDDQQLLTEVATVNPAMRATYERSLQSVNQYISDAKKSVAADPDDDDAREQLMQAYEQKAAVYEMAMSRAGQ